MAKIYPIFKKVITVVSGGPNVSFLETERLSEQSISVITIANETRQSLDVPAPQLILPDNPQFADTILQINGSAAIIETVQRADLGLANTVWPAMAPSGTPNNDAWGDAWTDATTGQTGVNHGTISPLSVTAIVTGAKIGWVEVDLTRFSGWVASGTSSLTWTYTNPNISAETMTLAYFTNSTRPFTESTLTQANQPSNATTTIGTWAAGASTTNGTWTETIGVTDINAMLGKWVCFKFTGSSSQISDVTIVSREGATPPQLTLSLSR